jgi:hypothetical protein
MPLTDGRSDPAVQPPVSGYISPASGFAPAAVFLIVLELA